MIYLSVEIQQAVLWSSMRLPCTVAPVDSEISTRHETARITQQEQDGPSKLVH